MSSGQWEVVGKSKKAQVGKAKNGKDDEKKPTRNGPKLEDILPNSQIKTFYEGMEVDDTSKPGKENKKNGEKKAGKKTVKADPPKPKPKNLEGALQAIDATELANIITTNRVRFTNAPLVWLKEVAVFLNSKTQVDVDDPTFSNQPSSFPVSVLPEQIKTLLDSVIADAGKANALIFYDVTLTALVNDLSRGQSVNGHRVLLQLLAQGNPEFCVYSANKSAELRNSYQNRPPICLSLLWALGQGGYKDFEVGMRAWQELYLPIIELKSYSKYIVAYLTKILDIHSKMASSAVTQEKFFAMIETVNSKKSSIPKDLSSDLIKQFSKYKDIYFKSNVNKLQVTFNQLMKRLPSQFLSGASLDPFHAVIVQSLVACLERDDSCNATWRQLFNRCGKQSATLLDYIDSNWSEVSPKLKLKSLKATVLQYKEVSGEALKGKKKDETLVKTNKICQDILDRMTSTTRRFPWLWASFVLLLSIAGLIAYDVSRVGGNFPKSSTGRLLNDLGVLEQSQRAWQKTLSTSARGYLWLETNAPIYYTTAIEFSKPYAELAKDVVIIGYRKTGVLIMNVRSYVEEKTPVVEAAVEEYIPGFIDTTKTYSKNIWNTLSKHFGDQYQNTANYLGTQIFVGEWAPENLQNRTQSALNVTRQHVASYLHWLRQQVHVYSEIP